MKPPVRSLVAGVLWGILGAIVYQQAPSIVVIGIVMSGPLIGFTVFMLSRWSYRSCFLLALWTVPSVYLAAALLGTVGGALDGITRGSPMMMEDLAGALWGISIPSPFWLIYPLAYFTHLWVRSGRTRPLDSENPI